MNADTFEPRLCIVGAGGLSTNRIYPTIGAAGARLEGVCDLDRQKAQRNARRFGGAVFSDMEAMIDELRPDGVIVCVGPTHHAELAKLVMRKGVAVYTEKPPAPSAADAFEVARVSRETGVLCTTAFKKRYSIAYDTAKKWLGRFPLSDHYSISIDYASSAYANDPANERSLFLLDFAIHVIDLVGYLMGDVEEVFAFTKDEHAYAVSLRFVSGAVGVLNLNDGRTFKLPTEEVELTVKGGNFMSIHNSSSWRITENGEACGWREPPTFISAGDSGYETGHLGEIRDFVEALAEKRTTRSNIYESYKSMVLYEAIRDAARSGRAVRPAYKPLCD